MDCRPPSRITGPGTPPTEPKDCEHRRGRDRARRRTGPTKVLGLVVILATSVVLLAAGCSDDTVVPATLGLKLEPGVTYSVDLDGDGEAELVRFDESLGSLTLKDGGLLYRSREKWRVVEAHLGDTDNDGLPEVVALLDSDRGRHLGLFAYFGGEYRERFVSSPLLPRPISLRVSVLDGGGNTIVVIEESRSGQTKTTAVYRWNGFGFTIDYDSAERGPG